MTTKMHRDETEKYSRISVHAFLSDPIGNQKLKVYIVSLRVHVLSRQLIPHF